MKKSLFVLAALCLAVAAPSFAVETNSPQHKTELKTKPHVTHTAAAPSKKTTKQ